MANEKYIDLMGKDFTEYMVSENQIRLFHEMVSAQERCKRPLPECYKDVADALNIEAQILGKPKKVFIQGNPRLN